VKNGWVDGDFLSYLTDGGEEKRREEKRREEKRREMYVVDRVGVVV